MEIRIEPGLLNKGLSIQMDSTGSVLTLHSADINRSGAAQLTQGSIITTAEHSVQSPCLLHDLSHLSWAEIEAIGLSGKARETFALGAVKQDRLIDGFPVKWQIIGFDHDDLADGAGKAAITWELVRIYKDKRSMNEKYSNDNGWDACDMNKWLNDEFLGFFFYCSSEMKAVIKPVIKLTGVGCGKRYILRSMCNFWLKSEKELYGRCFYSTPGEGHWYDFYRQEDTPYFKERAERDFVDQWLRSPSIEDNLSFCAADSTGRAARYDACGSSAFSPCFCC